MRGCSGLRERPGTRSARGSGGSAGLLHPGLARPGAPGARRGRSPRGSRGSVPTLPPHLPGRRRAAPLGSAGEGPRDPGSRREGGGAGKPRRGRAAAGFVRPDSGPPGRQHRRGTAGQWDGQFGEAHGDDGGSPHKGSWGSRLQRKRKSRG